jgi:NADPH:quinone reductase-like Zn-dependent oxidoreductase
VRAVRFPRSGDPSVLRVEDVPEPAPPTGDRILVRVAASSVNGTDLGIRSSGAPAVFGRNVGLGFDVVGEVLACGPNVTAFDPGDRIAALLPHSGGGQAERVVLRQGRAARVPESVSTTDAAAVPLAGLTALQALYGKAGLRGRPGARVLVHGASGGIGSFAVQLALLAGAHVTGTASPAKQDHVRSLGAHVVLGHDEALRPGERFDVVLDTPGRLEPAAARPVLADDGVLVTTRVVSAAGVRALAADALAAGARSAGVRQRTGPRFTFVATSARSADLAHLLELVRTGRLRVPVDRVLPMAEIADAHRRAEGREVLGKVVVSVG